MSGRTKKILYTVASGFLALCAVAGTALLLYFALKQGGPLSSKEASVWVAVCAAVAVAVILPLNLIVHELGHVLFGLMAGLFPVSVQIGYFMISRNSFRFTLNTDIGGMSAMLARNGKNLRRKLTFTACGGAVFNIVYGVVFLALWFFFPSPAMLFFSLLAPLNLYEGISALLPAQRPSGATDGAVIVGLQKKQPFAEVMLAVLKTQSTLVKGTYADVRREWLFGVPVIREDDVLFAALTQLKWQYLFCHNDEKGAVAQLKRLDDIFEYTESADLACDLAYAYSVFLSDAEKAADYFERAKASKGSVNYACAAAACDKMESAAACNCAEKETWEGVKDLGYRMIERLPHII